MENESKKKTAPCSVCLRVLENPENAAILSMGHFGNPRILCSECEGLINTALRSHDVSEAEDAIAKLGETVSECSSGDDVVLETVEEIFKTATERKEKIKAGTYDFSLDDAEEEFSFEEIPEEFLETEEDKAATEREEQINKKFGKVMDIITAVVFTAAVALFLYFILR